VKCIKKIISKLAHNLRIKNNLYTSDYTFYYSIFNLAQTVMIGWYIS